MKQFPYTERGLNDAINDGVFIGWAKYHNVYNEKVASMYQTWLDLVCQYKKLEYTYLLNKCDVL